MPERLDSARHRPDARLLLSGWRLALVVLVASAALGLVHYLDRGTEDDAPPAASSGDDGPDLEIEDATVTAYRANGELKYRLRSPLIEQFNGMDVTYLRRPDLTLFDPPDPPWRITAQRGTIHNANQTDRTAEEQVVLQEDVEMEQRYDDGRHYVLVTPSITIYPERQYAETTQDVMITTHAGRTKAVGLKGDLDQGLLTLFSSNEKRVHTVILADQFK
jgi:lipopolysaccharide export system protein LptC